MDTDQAEGSLKAVENNIKNLKGKVLKIEKLGRKRLAYEINKNKDGIMALVLFDLDTENVAEFRKQCQLNEEILRLTLVRLDLKDKAAFIANYRQRDLAERDNLSQSGMPRRERDGEGGGGFRRRPPFHQQNQHQHQQQAPQQHQAGAPAAPGA
jgi:small subunit ribosomal protein S6